MNSVSPPTTDSPAFGTSLPTSGSPAGLGRSLTSGFGGSTQLQSFGASRQVQSSSGLGSSGGITGGAPSTRSSQSALTESEVFEEVGHLPHFEPHRKFLADVFNSSKTDSILCLVLLYSLIIVVVETDDQAEMANLSNGIIDMPEPEPRLWIQISNVVLSLFYVAEVSARLYTFRWWFFHSSSNILDLVIVVVDIFMEALQLATGRLMSVSFLRIFRLTRLRRSVGLMKWIPELSLLMRGLVDTVRTLFWGTLMILLVLMVWSIIAVQVVHPVSLRVEDTGGYSDCPRCSRAFASVYQASLTLYQQLVVGDDWSSVSIPIIEHTPFTVVFFVAVQVSVSIGLMNLLLAVIVERASAARTEDIKELMKVEQREKQKLQNRLTQMFADMDEDNSGLLSMRELKHGYQTNEEFTEILAAMGIDEEDLDIVYSIMVQEGENDDESGGVRYDTFVEQLWKMKSQDMHTLLVFIKFYVMDVRSKVVNEISALEKVILNDCKLIRSSVEKMPDQRAHELRKLEEVVKENQDVSTMSAAVARCVQDELKATMSQGVLPLQRVTNELSEMMERQTARPELEEKKMWESSDVPLGNFPSELNVRFPVPLSAISERLSMPLRQVSGTGGLEEQEHVHDERIDLSRIQLESRQPVPPCEQFPIPNWSLIAAVQSRERVELPRSIYGHAQRNASPDRSSGSSIGSALGTSLQATPRQTAEYRYQDITHTEI